MSGWSNTINLRKLRDEIRDGANDGLLLGAEHVLAVSDDTVPIEEATLSRSGRVSTDTAGLRAAVSYDTPYAVVQHEDTSLQHDAGRSAKYLENAFNSTRATVAKIISIAIRRKLGT